MKFKKEYLQEMADHDYAPEGFVIKQNKLVSTSRWSKHYGLVFEFEKKFYETSYSVGATEYQDERPYEYDSDMVECFEFFPKETIVIDYVRGK